MVYATSCFLHLHTWSVLRNIMFLALAHMVGATQHHVSCTCTHGRCYATSNFLHLHTWSVLRNIMFLALAHMVGATQHHVSCTCTHGRCYATSCFLHLHTWSVLRNIMFLALAHMVGATQHHVSCTCTHGRCYATSCFLHLHTWSVLRNIMFLVRAHMVAKNASGGGASERPCLTHLGQQSSIPKHHGVLTLVLDAHQWRKVCWALSTCAVSCRQRAFRPLDASERPFQTRKKITVEPYCLAASRGWVGIWVEGAGGYMGGVRGWVWVWDSLHRAMCRSAKPEAMLFLNRCSCGVSVTFAKIPQCGHTSWPKMPAAGCSTAVSLSSLRAPAPGASYGQYSLDESSNES